MAASPIDVTCPNCQAKPGDRCTQPDGLGRHEVKRFHYARESAAADVVEPLPAPTTLAETLLQLLTEDAAVSHLACDGGDFEVLASSEASMEDVTPLLEHVAHDHVSRRDILVHRVSTIVTGYELGVLMRLPVQSDAEQNWRLRNSPIRG